MPINLEKLTSVEAKTASKKAMKIAATKIILGVVVTVTVSILSKAVLSALESNDDIIDLPIDSTII